MSGKLLVDQNPRRWNSCFVGIHNEYLHCGALTNDSKGELEVNFGEYEFVYPDGEVETTPTSGQSDEGHRPR